MSDATPEAEVHNPIPLLERRVLGVLVEKEKTSKSVDAYPMTVNSIVTGCNQKSNRDPVMNLDEVEVEETLTRLQRSGLVSKITGGRVDRWRHLLYENWRVGKFELAILAELLMRGPQTEGDLRIRASRMNDIPELDQLRALLKPLVERKFVVYLSDPERRGAMLTHGFHLPQELSIAATKFASGSPEPASVSAPVPAASVVSGLDEKLTKAYDEILSLRSELASLRADLVTQQNDVTSLRAEFAALKASLGG
jgi:uncharacterized protein